MVKRKIRKEVGIAELKAHLSAYVRAAQRGREIVITDRETPVARLVPAQAKKWPFGIIPAARPIKNINEMRGITLTGVTPEMVEEAFAETRKDRIEEWLNLDTPTSTRRWW